jgi:hypothetical protein
LSSELRLKVLNGIDLKDERDKVRATAIATRSHQITFVEALTQCIEAKALKWKTLSPASIGKTR